MGVKQWSVRQKNTARRMIDAGESNKEISLRIGKPVEEVVQYVEMLRRLALARAVTSSRQSICWDCANAVPDPETGRGCSWSRRFEPVDGWLARRADLRRPEGEGGPVESYCVIDCPEFKEG